MRIRGGDFAASERLHFWRSWQFPSLLPPPYQSQRLSQALSSLAGRSRPSCSAPSSSLLLSLIDFLSIIFASIASIAPSPKTRTLQVTSTNSIALHVVKSSPHLNNYRACLSHARSFTVHFIDLLSRSSIGAGCTSTNQQPTPSYLPLLEHQVLEYLNLQYFTGGPFFELLQIHPNFTTQTSTASTVVDLHKARTFTTINNNRTFDNILSRRIHQYYP